jgi:4-diphosphocytidyl-2-C-methyl-D-erythritol kinase
LWVVLVKPPIAVSTADVYGQLNLCEVSSHPDTNSMVQALASGDPERIVAHLGNVLENVTFQMHPEVEKLKHKMVKFGALGALMSGSGPTVFGIADRQNRAQRIYNAFRGFSKDVYLTRFL